MKDVGSSTASSKGASHAHPHPAASLSSRVVRAAGPTIGESLSTGPDATAKPAREATLFHLPLEHGWDAEPAYTAGQRIRAMSSEIVAAGLEPVMAELRQIRESMAGFATKAELEKFETTLRREMAEREARLVKWMFGAMLAEVALIVGLVVGFVTLLK